MLESKAFVSINRGTVEDETVLNAQLLIKGGFVEKVMPGIYVYLPLGWRVYKKIETIIRTEMFKIGGEEVFLSALLPKELWIKSGRWEAFGDILMKVNDRDGREYVLGPTHEELIAELAKKYILTYRDLPKAIFQIQEKFRDEQEVKSGLLKTKEFIMKDLYSFHATRQDLDFFYEEMKKSYINIFNQCGLKSYIVEAAGGNFTDENVHEFMLKTEAGEETTVFCELCDFAQNKQLKEAEGRDQCPRCGGLLKEEKTVELGNIFKLGTKFSENTGAYFVDRDGEKKPILMGCYGIGLSRLMGSIAEIYHDEKGLVWPVSVAPFLIHLIKINETDPKIDVKIKKQADKLYQQLTRKGVEVLYDDRVEFTGGEKIAEADAIGIPYQIIITAKNLQKELVEIKSRNSGESELLKISAVGNYFKNINQ
ncbi:MAG TPA: His/Gly/Thr/Pro-type tRNA ligase C-terminal domain-containing protein [Candidatus Paceibacterota bacterium]|nr:His/Gly/Thr/Pro-type tRNA ligase C-terminal domain-containing protein [Candidatus Paceibacterota bacterium]